MTIGRANKFFLNFCEKIICYSNNINGLPNKFKNKIEISSPFIRKQYYEKKFKENNNEISTIMIVGGSQGAQIFDEIIHESILKISKIKPLKIIHQTSQKKVNFFKKFYSENNVENIVFNFDNNLDMLISQSDLCITRAGASSLAEIAILNVPFIAIPLPTSKDNHQFENANYYRDKDCCWIINQKSFDTQKFQSLLLNILKNKDDLTKKKKNLENLNYQNTWNNVNQNLLKILNEN
jgi:UDP-N-acetylglucosamine--N-acetylmuramyl-(pentapeptide) pyrophosphoryl-undecaprenol N-acetylglucosamine transferase